MIFLPVIIALALNQYLALPWRARLGELFSTLAQQLKQTLDGGDRAHGLIAWAVLVVPVCALVALACSLAYRLNPLLALLLNALVLYLLTSLNETARYLSRLPPALRRDELGEARSLLGAWREIDASACDTNQIVRLGIEQALIQVHRRWFAPIMWFVVLPGPAGALLYWLSRLLAENWASDRRETGAPFAWFACQAFEWIDWVPQRLTAVTFAIVGNFEDAVFCWRAQAPTWSKRDEAIVLASGAGALGVKLGDPVGAAADVEFRPTLGTGETADIDHLRSTEGLIWRAVVLWLGLLLLIALVRWFG
jgi:adenosylcobinamide-phosphate synthase